MRGNDRSQSICTLTRTADGALIPCCICKMSSVEATQKPLRVSPLIKFSRWSLLITGVLYGAYHHNRFSKKEEALREKAVREKPMRDAKLAAEKKRLLEEQQKFLDDLANPRK